MPKLPPDPDGQNDDRSDWAAAALKIFMKTTGTEAGDAVADLVADLHHWCDRNGQNWAEELARGEGHYATETTGRYLVHSPDGIPIQPDPFNSREAAEAALEDWVLLYVYQGYYAAVDGHIPVHELSARCRIELLPIP